MSIRTPYMLSYKQIWLVPPKENQNHWWNYYFSEHLRTRSGISWKCWNFFYMMKLS